MLIDLGEPVSHITIALLFRTVVAEHDAIRALVICLGDSPESFLAGGVPNLEFDILAVYWDVLNLKIDTYTHKISEFIDDPLTYSRNMRASERVLGESQQE